MAPAASCGETGPAGHDAGRRCIVRIVDQDGVGRTGPRLTSRTRDPAALRPARRPPPATAASTAGRIDHRHPWGTASVRCAQARQSGLVKTLCAKERPWQCHMAPSPPTAMRPGRWRGPWTGPAISAGPDVPFRPGRLSLPQRRRPTTPTVYNVTHVDRQASCRPRPGAAPGPGGTRPEGERCHDARVSSPGWRPSCLPARRRRPARRLRGPAHPRRNRPPRLLSCVRPRGPRTRRLRRR
jgi:hypothetical protein